MGTCPTSRVGGVGTDLGSKGVTALRAPERFVPGGGPLNQKILTTWGVAPVTEMMRNSRQTPGGPS